MAKPKARRDFVRSDRVAGVTFKNDDGSKRQDLIRQHCRKGTVLHLRHEPDNEKDPDAVGVYVVKGRIFRRKVQIGYLDREDARDLVRHMEGGGDYSAVVEKVLGGTRDKPALGVAYRIECSWNAVSDDLQAGPK